MNAPDVTRRELIRRAGRWLCGAALGGWLLATAGRRGGSRADTLCARCPSLASCGEPAGVRTRERLSPVPPQDVTRAVELCRESRADG